MRTSAEVARSLLSMLDGLVLRPGEAQYDARRTVWNAMVDRRPQLIVRATRGRDVATAVRAARELDLPIGIRCGGHSAAGHAVPDGGLMIDLGALDRASQRYGLATTAGNVSHTGVGGLTLGGGMGWLARQCGLACDNVLSYRVVTADGDTVTASATEHPELFWALRGGGGNFGVVTEFQFRLHPIGTHALSVEFDHPIENGESVLRCWRDLSADAPRQATFTADLSGRTLTVGYIWVGDPAGARRLLPAFRQLGRASAERVDAMTYLGLQTRDDSVGGHAYRRYGTGHYFTELTDLAISVLVSELGRHRLAPAVGFQAYGGAIADTADGATAFSHRAAAFELGIGARWADQAEDDAWIRATRSYSAVVGPFASGAYVNALGDEGAAGVRRAYSERKLARLTDVKNRYDPQNVFHLNHNIPPSGRMGISSTG